MPVLYISRLIWLLGLFALILPRLISGQTCPKTKPISYYQVKTTCQSMVELNRFAESLRAVFFLL